MGGMAMAITLDHDGEHTQSFDVLALIEVCSPHGISGLFDDYLTTCIITTGDLTDCT